MLGKTLCQAVCREFLNVATQPVPQDAVQRQVDPTVCGFCSADAGEKELPKVFGVPTCAACDDKLRHRPFPRWIKVSAVLLVLLLIGAFAYNLRFLRAHRMTRQAFRTLYAGRRSTKPMSRWPLPRPSCPTSPNSRFSPSSLPAANCSRTSKDAEAVDKMQYAHRGCIRRTRCVRWPTRR